MRKLALALLLLCVCTGVQAAPTEPFGTHLQAVPDAWFIDQRAQLIDQRKELIASIADQVRSKPQETWLAWVNQFVNLSNVGDCVPTAIIKLEVLRKLGFEPNDLRVVVGSEPREKFKHAVATVRTSEGWRVLDNGHLVAGYRALLDTQIRSSFYPLVAFQE